MRHEIQHLQHLQFGDLIDYKSSPVLRSELYKAAKKTLRKRWGYRGDEREIVGEVMAGGMAGNFDRLGLDATQAKALLWDLFTAIIERHGEAGYNLLGYAQPGVRQEIEHRAAANRAGASRGHEAADRQDDRGSQEGGQGGVRGGPGRNVAVQYAEPPRPPMSLR